MKFWDDITNDERYDILYALRGGTATITTRKGDGWSEYNHRWIVLADGVYVGWIYKDDATRMWNGWITGVAGVSYGTHVAIGRTLREAAEEVACRKSRQI